MLGYEYVCVGSALCHQIYFRIFQTSQYHDRPQSADIYSAELEEWLSCCSVYAPFFWRGRNTHVGYINPSPFIIFSININIQIMIGWLVNIVLIYLSTLFCCRLCQ